jgi:hypothetical protein
VIIYSQSCSFVNCNIVVYCLRLRADVSFRDHHGHGANLQGEIFNNVSHYVYNNSKLMFIQSSWRPTGTVHVGIVIFFYCGISFL